MQTQGMTEAATETTMAEQPGDEAAPEELFADEDEEGWESMEDLAPGQAAAEAASGAAVAEGDDTQGWEGLENLAAAEAAPGAAAAEGDDTEGWEEPQDLASAEAATAEGDAGAEEDAPAAEGEVEAAAAGEPEAAVDMHQVGLHSALFPPKPLQVHHTEVFPLHCCIAVAGILPSLICSTVIAHETLPRLLQVLEIFIASMLKKAC